jgi:Icc-related predicted phosphoesterase
MIIDCISDLHGCKPALQGGDLLIIAGDITARDRDDEWVEYWNWLSIQQYEKIVYIAGNHDALCENPQRIAALLKNEALPKSRWASEIEYLYDNGITIEWRETEDTKWGPKHLPDLKSINVEIWGSPWTPEFLDWHFMKKRGEDIAAVWAKIPEDTDILITHGPPYGILDHVPLSSRGDEYKNAGCEELLKTVMRIKPRLHVFGHIHYQGGQQITIGKTTFVNASIMDEDYNPVHKPVRIIYDP